MRIAVKERATRQTVYNVASLCTKGATYDPERALMWRTRPDLWVRERMGGYLWSKQVEVALSVVEHPRTLVHSSNGVGKSYLAAYLALWWLDVHPPGEAMVISTAPTFAQVEAILWRYIGALTKELRRTDLEVSGTRARFIDDTGRKHLTGFGRRPKRNDISAFQGIHDPYVLVLGDEGCHDDQTDVMTEHGWRRFADLDGTEQLLTMNPATGLARYVTPSRITAFHYTGPMYETDQKGLNFCVTPDHEMWTADNYKHEWSKATAEQCMTSSTRWIQKHIGWGQQDLDTYTIPGLKTARKTYPGLTVDVDLLAELAGYMWSEGNICWGRQEVAQSVRVTQTKHNGMLDRIEKLCEQAGIVTRRYDDCVDICNRPLAAWYAAHGANQRERWLPAVIRNLSVRQANIYLDAHQEGDGYERRSHAIIYTASEKLAGHLQEMILKTGYPSVVHARSTEGHEIDSRPIATSHGWTVTRPTVQTEAKWAVKKTRTVHYDGTVYCATVEDHMLFTRRNGYTMWSGNCGIETDLYEAMNALVTNDASRILIIGNPDRSDGHFYRSSLPGSGYNVVHISALDSPMFPRADGTREADEPGFPQRLIDTLVTPAWAERMAKDFEHAPHKYRSKVLGLFTADNPDSVITASMMANCRYEPWDLIPGKPISIGVDVGGGRDLTTIACSQKGPQGWRLWEHGEQLTKTPQDAHRYVHDTVLWYQHHGLPVDTINIDAIGIGWALVGWLQNDGLPAHAVTTSSRANDPVRYKNLRAELWWEFREAAIAGIISLAPTPGINRPDANGIPETREAEYTTPGWKTARVGGMIIVESKDDIRPKLNGKSTDHADAAFLSLYVPPTLEAVAGHPEDRVTAAALEDWEPEDSGWHVLLDD
jgi:hypothetical protein